jgi:flagellar basal-body rod protein FlgC
LKISNGFFGMNASAKGLSIHRKKMNVIAENIASADNVRDADGNPYRRKFLNVIEDSFKDSQGNKTVLPKIKLNTTNKNHITGSNSTIQVADSAQDLKMETIEDESEGDWTYMPEHPDANEEGYVELSNVNIINEMVEMIAATRSYEANLTAFNASKQMAKDSLEI